jgi:hypothetical protein
LNIVNIDYGGAIPFTTQPPNGKENGMGVGLGKRVSVGIVVGVADGDGVVVGDGDGL